MDGEVPEYGAAAGMAGRDVQATLSIDDYCFTHELLEVLRHDEDQKPAAAASASTTNSSSNMAGESEMASWLCEIFQHQQQQRDYRQSTATKSSLGGGSSGSGSDKKPGAKAGSSGGRRRRSSTGKAAEQRRRDKINDKMRTLQQLMPNCTKTDKASTLEEVIRYIKSLQHQMQVLSNGNGLPAAILPPSGMVPTTCMQPVGDTFGGQVAPVALSQYPFAPMTMLARPQYSNSVPLALPSIVLYRRQIGSVNAAQQLARRRHLVSPSDLVVPTSHMGE